ncbi:putative radical SAM enzyme, TIGR03279 family [Hathewaya proteolytica DSM 3090]|uniref:Putative radical SAM enzyme, TIGR03279 family n=1 Tax=Hathewaya proteolytica DSM 3090 TaxID=1121331 RepID=A0A1M6JBD8_9CLOT|nr:DUF512 domain-containing protein [Hathewaya proteolytica]SHJ44038.1 putative radical SAM enzyme, TIGR03279 family [Hathewaya proteolytica DSM 3090]
MKNLITTVKQGSIAEEVGIELGDYLLSINDNEIEDIIDYKYLVTDEYLVITVEKANGEVWDIEIEKEYDEDLGLDFQKSIMDEARSCTNKCIFCFIDQMPKGMRKTLYFKDDDSRLSFLQGNFLTLTNMKDKDIERIIKYKISPINISVHTTNPELRVKMLKNKFAGKIMEYMQKLSKAGIKMNCQIVMCPGINDGEELLKTVNDLYTMYPNVEAIAAVPVGVTKFRDNLFPMTIYNRDTAKKQLDIIKGIQEKFIKETGEPFIRLSDEFYIMAGENIPEKEFYGSFHQLEDGIGMMRMFQDNIHNTIKNVSKSGKGSFTFITGALAYDHVKYALDSIVKENNNIDIDVVKIKNNFFGETITVTGLITGKDIVEQLSNRKVNDYVVLPDNMIRRGYELSDDKEQVMLDDYTVDMLEKQLNRKVILCDYTGEDLIQIINEHCKEE